MNSISTINRKGKRVKRKKSNGICSHYVHVFETYSVFVSLCASGTSIFLSISISLWAVCALCICFVLVLLENSWLNSFFYSSSLISIPSPSLSLVLSLSSFSFFSFLFYLCQLIRGALDDVSWSDGLVRVWLLLLSPSLLSLLLWQIFIYWMWKWKSFTSRTLPSPYFSSRLSWHISWHGAWLILT